MIVPEGGGDDELAAVKKRPKIDPILLLAQSMIEQKPVVVPVDTSEEDLIVFCDNECISINSLIVETNLNAADALLCEEVSLAGFISLYKHSATQKEFMAFLGDASFTTISRIKIFQKLSAWDLKSKKSSQSSSFVSCTPSSRASGSSSISSLIPGGTSSQSNL